MKEKKRKQQEPKEKEQFPSSEVNHTSKVGVVDVPIVAEVAEYRMAMSKKDYIMSRKRG